MPQPTEDDEDLHSYWSELKLHISSASDTPAGRSLHHLILRAGKDTERDLRQTMPAIDAASLTSDMLAQFIAVGAGVYMQHWHALMREQSLSSLLSLMLASHDLTAVELKTFVRAMPLSMITRAVREQYFTAESSGIHALLAVEFHWRTEGGRDYNLIKEIDRFTVTVYPARLEGRPISFSLDEVFATPPSEVAP